MVFGVGDWIETKDGDIGLVVNVDNVRHTGGEVAVYFPAEVECLDVPVEDVFTKFLNKLAPRASL